MCERILLACQNSDRSIFAKESLEGVVRGDERLGKTTKQLMPGSCVGSADQ